MKGGIYAGHYGNGIDLLSLLVIVHATYTSVGWSGNGSDPG